MICPPACSRCGSPAQGWAWSRRRTKDVGTKAVRKQTKQDGGEEQQGTTFSNEAGKPRVRPRTGRPDLRSHPGGRHFQMRKIEGALLKEMPTRPASLGSVGVWGGGLRFSEARFIKLVSSPQKKCENELQEQILSHIARSIFI